MGSEIFLGSETIEGIFLKQLHMMVYCKRIKFRRLIEDNASESEAK